MRVLGIETGGGRRAAINTGIDVKRPKKVRFIGIGAFPLVRGYNGEVLMLVTAVVVSGMLFLNSVVTLILFYALKDSAPLPKWALAWIMIANSAEAVVLVGGICWMAYGN